MVIGSRDETLPANQALHGHLESLGISHEFTVLPGLGHEPLRVMPAMGDARWAWYRNLWVEKQSAEGAESRRSDPSS